MPAPARYGRVIMAGRLRVTGWGPLTAILGLLAFVRLAAAVGGPSCRPGLSVGCTAPMRTTTVTFPGPGDMGSVPFLVRVGPRALESKRNPFLMTVDGGFSACKAGPAEAGN